jgi:sugar/nucleoside kinase (ribokinase family)
VTVDLAVATPAFLDLTFLGLEGLPAPGEERFAADLVRSPGGGAITAVGAARLELATALTSPTGEDDAGAFIRTALADLGVVTLPPQPGIRTPITAVLPVAGDRAMVTYSPRIPADAAALRSLRPRAVVANIDEVDVLPPGAWVYATCGDDGARAYAGRPPEALRAVRALLVNEPEALLLAGTSSCAEAVVRLAEVAPTVVVTRGRKGAVGMVEGRRLEIPGYDVGAPVDTTGAGDLFCAAWTWADLRGAEPEVRLAWAGLYGALSVTAATAAEGAVRQDVLIEEGTRRGLPPLPAAS